jgi:GT2 family glycosyltransferase
MSVRADLGRVLDILKAGGLRQLAVKSWNRLHRLDPGQIFARDRQQLAKTGSLPPGPVTRFSIIVPLYNTDPVHLKALVDSVQAQTYPEWQLCLANGSDSQHPEVDALVTELAATEPRLTYRLLEQNLGIAGNTNAALEMAEGDYIALLDHDDLLAPEALAEVRRAILRDQADFIYCDEVNFVGEPQPGQIILAHCKPDFAPDTLRSNNYICHLSVFAKALADAAGPFDSRCDGSQDYDYILRLTEQAKRIVHIPHFLYYWRVHSRSVASDLAAKPYCLDAARLALSKHLDRLGWSGQVENNSILSTYRIRYQTRPADRILILAAIRNRRQLSAALTWAKQPHGRPAGTVELALMLDGNTPAWLNQGRDLAVWQQASNEGRLPVTVRFVQLTADEAFPEICNREAAASTVDLLLFVDGEVTSVSENWLEELAMLAQRPDVGVVGPKLLCRGLVAHTGLATGIGGLAAGLHDRRVDGEPGYMARLTFTNNVSLVDGACLMLSRTKFLAVGGFDESYREAFHDVDLGLRLRAAGLLSVMTPFAAASVATTRRLADRLLHRPNVAIQADRGRLLARWASQLAAPDPYYSPHFGTRHARFDQR